MRAHDSVWPPVVGFWNSDCAAPETPQTVETSGQAAAEAAGAKDEAAPVDWKVPDEAKGWATVESDSALYAAGVRALGEGCFAEV